MKKQQFILDPGYPTAPVSLCCVSCDAKETIKFLKNRAVEVLTVEHSSILPKSLSSHADLQLLHLGGNKVLVNFEQQKLIEKLSERGFEVTAIEGIGPKYPQDCLFNHLPFSPNYIIGNNKCMPNEAKEGRMIINVNQGYSRCSSLRIGKNRLLTGDISIYNAALSHKIDVELVNQSKILLPGYDNGFLGGTGGMIDEREVVTFGSADGTAIANVFQEIYEKEGIKFTATSAQPLTDIGGIIPLMQFA